MCVCVCVCVSVCVCVRVYLCTLSYHSSKPICSHIELYRMAFFVHLFKKDSMGFTEEKKKEKKKLPAEDISMQSIHVRSQCTINGTEFGMGRL